MENLLQMWLTEENHGIIDCMNGVNILSFYTRQRSTPYLEMIFKHGNLQNMIDSNMMYPSNYLLQQNNLEGLSTLFNHYKAGGLKINNTILDYGLTY